MDSGSSAEGRFYRGQCHPRICPPCPQGTLGSLRRKESELSQVADCSGMAPFDSSPVDKTQLASEEGIISYLGMFDFTPHLPQAEGKQALKSGTGHISLDCSRT